MHPDLGALAMSLSSFCVCANALRLNRFDRALAAAAGYHVTPPRAGSPAPPSATK